MTNNKKSNLKRGCGRELKLKLETEKNAYNHDVAPAWSTFRHHVRFSTIVAFDTAVLTPPPNPAPSSLPLTTDRLAARDRVLFTDDARNEPVHFDRIL